MSLREWRSGGWYLGACAQLSLQLRRCRSAAAMEKDFEGRFRLLIGVRCIVNDQVEFIR
jgi:hypothetical protein